ncbi:MAG: signal peptidase I [Acidobacteria bacterium]|nr:signal peptidase I [Acidobacteriota bacterium]
MSAEAEAKTPAPERSTGSSAKRLWREWIMPLAIILLVVISFRSAFADWNDVPTPSMVPTIVGGDRIFVNKLAYSLRVPLTQIHIVEWDQPKRGDIIVFFSPDENRRLVKRVVGLPGDVIELRNNRLVINGQVARYEWLDPKDLNQGAQSSTRQGRLYEEEIGGMDHPVLFQPYPLSNRWERNFGPVQVPEGQYFVMGDNRDNSKDSRYFGTVERHRIVGRASAVAFSLDRDHGFKPRWSRSFMKLL